MDYKKRLNKNITLFYFESFFTALIFVIPVWVAFERRILSFTEMALIESLASLSVISLELPTGAFADLIGKRKAIILGWLIRGSGNIYLAFATSLPMFILGFVICAVGTALVSGSETALIYDSLKEAGKEDFFGKFNARAGFIYRSALIFSTFLGGFLYHIWIGLPYVMMGISEIIATGFIFLMIEPQIDTAKFTLRNYMRQTRDGFKELLKSKYMKKLTLYYTLVGGITWTCLYYFNQPFAADLGYSEIGQSILFAVLYLASSLMVYVLTETEHLLSKSIVYLGFPVIMAISLIPGAVATKYVAPFLLLGILFTGSSRFAILDKYANKEFLSKYRATAVSSLNMLVSIFYVLVVGISGKIQDIYNTKIIFTFLGLLTTIVIIPIAVNLIQEDRRRSLISEL